MTVFSYTFSMPAGVPGDVTRHENVVLEPNIIDPAYAGDSAPTVGLVYGNPVKLVSGLVQAIQSGDAAADVYGFLIRPYPTNSSQDAQGVSTPPTSGLCDVLKFGYFIAKLNGATAAAKGGAVYVRKLNAASGKPIGGIEAAADSSNMVVVANAYFMGPADADGNVEIAFGL